MRSNKKKKVLGFSFFHMREKSFIPFLQYMFVLYISLKNVSTVQLFGHLFIAKIKSRQNLKTNYQNFEDIELGENIFNSA